MDSNLRTTQFKSGLWLCWLSLLALPVGLLAIGGGPCGGHVTRLGPQFCSRPESAA
jgi:hypothetical protein